MIKNILDLRSYQQRTINETIDSYISNKSQTFYGVIEMPTGSGKSLVQASLIDYFIKEKEKIICVTHVKELIEQNRKEYQINYNKNRQHNVCTVSAGAGETYVNNHANIFFCGIQTLVNRIDKFNPKPRIVIIDECHRVSHKEETSYRKLLSELAKQNNLFVIGMTATPYRLNYGYIYGNYNRDGKGFFNELIAKVSMKELVDDGHLVEIKCKGAKLKASFDIDKLATDSTWEFDKKDVESQSVDDIRFNNCMLDLMPKIYGKKTIVFGSNIEHCKKIETYLNHNTFKARSVFGDTVADDRKNFIQDFKDNKLNVLISLHVLTTGFNVPDIECVVLLRPTKSTSLFVQMVGRGMRTAPNKDYCLVLDYGQNFMQHGFVDNPIITWGRDRGKSKKPSVKICPKCDTVVIRTARHCPNTECNHEFEINTSVAKFDLTAAEVEKPLSFSGKINLKNFFLAKPNTNILKTDILEKVSKAYLADKLTTEGLIEILYHFKFKKANIKAIKLMVEKEHNRLLGSTLKLESWELYYILKIKEHNKHVDDAINKHKDQHEYINKLRKGILNEISKLDKNIRANIQEKIQDY